MSYLFCSQRWSPCGPRGGLNGRWWTWHSTKRWTEVERRHHKMSQGGFPHPQICRCRFWCSRMHSCHGTPAQSGERWGGQRNPLLPQLTRSSQYCRDTGLGSLDWRYCQMKQRGFLHIWHLLIRNMIFFSDQIAQRLLHFSYLNLHYFLATWYNF